MMITDLLTVGTPQGIMTAEATVSVKGRGRQAMAMIIMAAGIAIDSWSHVKFSSYVQGHEKQFAMRILLSISCPLGSFQCFQ